MKIIYTLIKLLVFIVLVLLAVTNTQMTTFNYVPGQSVDLPLIVLLLLFFIIGALFGVLAMFGRLLKLRSDVGSLRGKVKKTAALAAKEKSSAGQQKAQ